MVACAQQEAQDDEACQQRRAALAYEGQGKAGKRDKARNAAHDDECLQDDNCREAHCHERAYVALRAHRDKDAADGKAQVQKQHARRAQKARLFGDGAEDEVGFDDRDLVGHTVADAHAEQAAVGDAEDRLHQLVARVSGVGEGVEPRINAHLHVAEQEVCRHETQCHKDKADEDVGVLARCHVQHGHKHEEQHQSRAQVLFEHDNQQCDGPHEDHGNQRAHVGHAERAHLVVEHGKHLAVLRQIGCQKYYDADLRQLARLDGEAADGKPDARTVDFVADNGQHRRHQKQDARRHDGVLVVCQLVQVLHERQNQHHEHHAQEQPAHLFHGKVGRQAGDKRDADARKRERKRQDCRVGAGGKFANGQVSHHEGGEHAQRNGEIIERYLLTLVHGNHGEQQYNKRRCDAQKQQLGIASGHGLLAFVGGFLLLRRVGVRVR